MKRVLVLLFALTMVAASCNNDDVVLEGKPAYSDGVVSLAGRSVSVDIARDANSKALGLSGRENLEENQGMLFIFRVPDFLEFWMKDMKIPIDIVWVKGDEIVGVSADVQPEPGVELAKLRVYKPKVPADRVIELKAGWAARNGLKIGDKIEITEVVE